MSLNSQFKNWYNYAICTAQGFSVTRGIETLNAIPPKYFVPYYRNFLIPLAYIASGSEKPFTGNTLGNITRILGNTKTSTVHYGDEVEWQKLYETLIQDAQISINEIMEILDTLTSGKGWMYVLFEFVHVYKKLPKVAIKQCIIDSWTEFMQYHKSVTVWFGFADTNCFQPANDVSLLYNTKTNKLEGDITGVSFIYPEQSHVLAGGTAIASILKLNFYDLDGNRIMLLKELVRQSPVYKNLLPSEEVFCIDAKKIIKKKVNLADTGEGGVPPIEVLKVYHALPDSLLKTADNEVEAINFHVATGASVHQSVIDWLHQKEVMSFLNEKIGVKPQEVKAEKLHDVVDDLNLPIKKNIATELKLPTASSTKQVAENNELQLKYDKLKKDYEELQAAYRKLESENIKLDETSKSNTTEVDRLKSQLKDAMDLLEKVKHQRVQEKAAVTDNYKKLTQGDKFYNALVVLCSEIRLASFDVYDYHGRVETAKLYPIIERVAAIDRREDTKMLLDYLNDRYAGASQENKFILEKVIHELR